MGHFILLDTHYICYLKPPPSSSPGPSQLTPTLRIRRYLPLPASLLFRPPPLLYLPGFCRLVLCILTLRLHAGDDMEIRADANTGKKQYVEG